MHHLPYSPYIWFGITLIVSNPIKYS
jgi:hypothetical protein